MEGVCALADAAHAIERGNAKAGGKIPVGAAAYGGFVELPSNLVRDDLGFPVKRGNSWGALPWIQAMPCWAK